MYSPVDSCAELSQNPPPGKLGVWDHNGEVETKTVKREKFIFHDTLEVKITFKLNYLLLVETTVDDTSTEIIHSFPFHNVIQDKFSSHRYWQTSLNFTAKRKYKRCIHPLSRNIKKSCFTHTWCWNSSFTSHPEEVSELQFAHIKLYSWEKNSNFYR